MCGDYFSLRILRILCLLVHIHKAKDAQRRSHCENTSQAYAPLRIGRGPLDTIDRVTNGHHAVVAIYPCLVPTGTKEEIKENPGPQAMRHQVKPVVRRSILDRG